MPQDKLRYLFFSTIHDVLKAEKLLKNDDVTVEVVPVPRSLSSDCGVCLKTFASPQVLAKLLGPIAGIRCFVSDGEGYCQDELPGNHEA